MASQTSPQAAPTDVLLSFFPSSSYYTSVRIYSRIYETLQPLQTLNAHENLQNFVQVFSFRPKPHFNTR